MIKLKQNKHNKKNNYNRNNKHINLDPEAFIAVIT